MKLGIVGVFRDGWLNGQKGTPERLTPRFANIQEMARRAEEAGLDSFWVRDHLLYQDPDLGETGCWGG